MTLAPGLTFWDAGEFIAAVHTFGIPHPPGTPLYIAVGRVWSLSTAWLLGPARALNLLSAMCTALAGGITAWLISRKCARSDDTHWGAVAGALVAGLMASVWSNALETEVYSVALLHGVLMLACARRASDGESERHERWLACTAYLMLLAPAVHLSVLLAAPAAIVLAGRRSNGSWRVDRIAVLSGALLIAAGLGRVSPTLAGLGVLVVIAAIPLRRRQGATRVSTPAVSILAVALIAASALLIMLVRAQHDPAINQGNPSTLSALFSVVGRRQYAVAPLFPRQAPIWLQAANVAQYIDWQAGLGWGRGIFTTPWRVGATVLFVLLAIVGTRSMRRDDRRLADAMLMLLLCGTVGAASYLNMRPGASLGWGLLPDDVPHEARERDYFFVFGFWAWGVLAGYGALAVLRARDWARAFTPLVALVPLAGNGFVVDRARGDAASAARRVASAFLASTPPNAVFFAAGDNDSYPLWYLQQVEHVRRDVVVVTVPLLPANWYAEEVARRTGWRWLPADTVSRVNGLLEWRAALIAQAARRAGRVIVASPLLTAAERSILGGEWVLSGAAYVSSGPRTGRRELPSIDSARAREWVASFPPPASRTGSPSVDDAVHMMLGYLQCSRLVQPDAVGAGSRDSLEVRCNFR